MLHCKHKSVIPVLNKGYVSQICRLHNKPCNTAICARCPDFDEETNVHQIEVDFPKRSNQEIDQIRRICHQCPLFDVTNQTCVKMPYEWACTDTYAEFPNNHCPEGKW